MIKQLLRKWLNVDPPKDSTKPSTGVFSTDPNLRLMRGEGAQLLGEAYDRTFKKLPTFKRELDGVTVAMDSGGLPDVVGTKQQFVDTSLIPVAQVYWYGSQSFIGYPMCSMLSQHWLIMKCCLMPARDAVRKWFEITSNDGTEIKPEVIAEINEADKVFRLKKNLIEFVQKGRVFGIRVALFVVDTDNPREYYGNPFNIDAVKPGTYRGISQIDPYWCTPVPDEVNTSMPADIHFYEPTWWQIQGIRYHRSHLLIFRTEELPDVLKPSYSYGGVSIPQKIYERVYASERTANEAPMLALTKRTTVMTTDLAAAQADPDKFYAKMAKWSQDWNNYGIKNIGLDDKVEQHETSLADLDAVIMTQYQLVAAAANVPSVKLLGTSPKGFNATGEFEESNYHEELESLQSEFLTEMVQRHHALVIKSLISPNAPLETGIMWNSLDAMTAKEMAELNKLKADTGATLSSVGAIDGQDERNRIISDGESGYNGLAPLAPEPDESGEKDEAPNDRDDAMSNKADEEENEND